MIIFQRRGHASNAIYKFSTLQMFYQTTLQFRDMIVSEGYLMQILYHHNLLFQTLINLVKTDFPSYQCGGCGAAAENPGSEETDNTSVGDS